MWAPSHPRRVAQLVDKVWAVSGVLDLGTIRGSSIRERKIRKVKAPKQIVAQIQQIEAIGYLRKVLRGHHLGSMKAHNDQRARGKRPAGIPQ